MSHTISPLTSFVLSSPQRMCSSLSIDPLSGPIKPASSMSAGSFWSSLLNLSDWTYELSIQIIDVSLSTRSLNGGLIPLPDLIRRISRLRGIAEEGAITEDDIKRAVETMAPLGSGLEIISLGGGLGGSDRKALRAGAGLVGSDVTALVGLAMSTGGRLVVEEVVRSLGWHVGRVQAVLQEEMVERDGVAWVDEQAETEGGREYWVTGVVEWGE